MDQIICFSHPEYSGSSSPELSCEQCCKIYVSAMRNKKTMKNIEISQWLKDKSLDSSKLQVPTNLNNKYSPFPF